MRKNFYCIKYAAIEAVLWPLWFLRLFMSQDYRLYQALNLRVLQWFMDRVARLRTQAAFLKASNTCPAYRKFLDENHYEDPIRWSLEKLPIMTKENYVKHFGIEERCYGGEIPTPGVVIDESSGSSGVPNNWIRSRQERGDIKRTLQLNYQLLYGDKRTILLNCFALGPWATGMNVSMSLVDVGILKSIGPDALKLENTLKVFGAGYKYLVFAYPPFAKLFVDGCQTDLTPYHMDLVVGGEGVSEALRRHLLRSFKSVVSSYGASDLEINIGVETPLTQKLRALCLENPSLSRALFGKSAPPMIFQYNPLDYVIETQPNGELLFTICRQDGAAPKIRYKLGDLGGTFRYGEFLKKLEANGVDAKNLADRRSHFPLLFVFGRGDLSVPFYGAKVFASDVENVVSQDDRLIRSVSSFQLQSLEDEKLERTLVIHLERMNKPIKEDPPPESLQELFYKALCGCNQDFREVSKMFGKESLRIVWHDYGSGPFKNRDIRIKNQYIHSAN